MLTNFLPSPRFLLYSTIILFSFESAVAWETPVDLTVIWEVIADGEATGAAIAGIGVFQKAAGEATGAAATGAVTTG